MTFNAFYGIEADWIANVFPLTVYSDIVLAACSDKSVAVFDMNVGKVVRTMKDAHTRNVHTICQNQVNEYISAIPFQVHLLTLSCLCSWCISNFACELGGKYMIVFKPKRTTGIFSLFLTIS